MDFFTRTGPSPLGTCSLENAAIGININEATAGVTAEPVNVNSLALSKNNLWRGDARMNMAVQFKLQDPMLSLEMALRKGGFNYPPKATGITLDDEQVSFRQRKNQLSRRVRQAKREGATGTHSSPSQPKKCPAAPVQSFLKAPVVSMTCSSFPTDFKFQASSMATLQPQQDASSWMAVVPQQQQPTPGYVTLTVLVPAHIVLQGDQMGSTTSSLSNSVVGDSWDNLTKFGGGEEEAPFNFGQPQNVAPLPQVQPQRPQDNLDLDPLLMLEEVQEKSDSHGMNSYSFGGNRSEQQDEGNTMSLMGHLGSNSLLQGQAEPQVAQSLGSLEQELRLSSYQQAMQGAGLYSQGTNVCAPDFHAVANAAWQKESERLSGLFSMGE